MAKNRYINTRFWDDQYITTLDPIEKLLFLYFLTNPLTDIAGIYEITIKRIAFDTGLDVEVINSILKRFELANKIFFFDGWVFIKNFTKHQAANENMQKGINRSFKELPAEIKEKVKAFETLSNPSEPIPLLNLTLPNLTKPIGSSAPTPQEQAKNFFTNPEKQIEVLIALQNKFGQKDLLAAELKKFVEYWTEPNKSGTKQRWELQTTFEIGRRIKTWLNNIKQFKQPEKKGTLVL